MKVELDERNSKSTRKAALKKVIANMSIGNDMSSVYHLVLQCINIQSLDVKKMVYLFLIAYGASNSEYLDKALDYLIKETTDTNTLIRALALRTISSMNASEAFRRLCPPLHCALEDPDPYILKTSTICVLKLFEFDAELVYKEKFLGKVSNLVHNSSLMVTKFKQGGC